MCGISGFLSKDPQSPDYAYPALEEMNRIQKHRGPDGQGVWVNDSSTVGLSHVRLSVIDLSPNAAQPMVCSNTGNAITFNGEIYNYIELRQQLGIDNFKTTSDTEVILKAYEAWGEACVDKFHGMFAFAIWDARKNKLFIARDRFGIKPFYYTIQNGVFYFASEIKTLLPFMDRVETSRAGLMNYFAFQFCLGYKTLFEGVQKLKPAHCGYVNPDLTLNIRQYWEVNYELDWHHTDKYFTEEVQRRLLESIKLHTRSDVPVGSYLSGGLDSSIVTALADETLSQPEMHSFTGKFMDKGNYDESPYARMLTGQRGITLNEIEITQQHFMDHIGQVIYHLDEPTAGPGSFPQFMVSRLVRDKGIKVVLGGQGGDEIFGGYTRYLIAYFEQCIKGAIDGTHQNGKFVVTYESIIPNLKSLHNYKPLIQEFWSEGIFDERDKRYFRLVNRANKLGNMISWDLFDRDGAFQDFKEVYWSQNVEKESYFDSMTHFDFKTLLPALLQVEDRMSMASGIESRVPFLDHSLVELVATAPADVKFQNGELKRLLKEAYGHILPQEILHRKDKMGFPVPLPLWMKESASFREFIRDIFASQQASNRFYLSDGFNLDQLIDAEGLFNRNIWALLSLELWQQQFHDCHRPFKAQPGHGSTPHSTEALSHSVC